MKLKKVLVISDNSYLIREFAGITEELYPGEALFSYACSPSNTALLQDPSLPVKPEALHVKSSWQKLASGYDLILSLHCKQLFPPDLVSRVRCINIHPGLNPHNRGWFPQVFSILNGLPLGATIHEIDDQLDHGPIIAQEQVFPEAHDTSLTAYNKVLEAELRLVRRHLRALVEHTYEAVPASAEGNVNYKKDFNDLCRLDLQEQGTFGGFINKLRALSHGDFRNAYFVDEATGKKVYVRIHLEREDTV
jgi:dTDP-4-amino-4,6-dideoxyglucose formyltransferase